jgi:hypothetical protein
MVTVRSIDLGVVPGIELTPSKRNKIVGASHFGATAKQISNLYKIPLSTVKDTIRLEPLRNKGKSLPRKGRPKEYDHVFVRNLLRFVRTNPKVTYAGIRLALPTTLKNDTLRDILKQHGIINWRAKKRPYLTRVHAQQRRRWCLLRKNLLPDEWVDIIFSDECSVERGAGERRPWVFRTPSQKWDKDMIVTYKKGKDISIMIWGAIWIGGRSDVVIMERDPTAERNGYTSASYMEVLEDQMPRCWQPGMTFMQDNARIHTSRAVRSWFEDQGIPLLDWPPYSPDLNPIEICWAWMKEWITDHYPELSGMGVSDEAYEALCEAIEQAWAALDQNKIDNLIRSMPRRCKAVLKAHGWQTKY